MSRGLTLVEVLAATVLLAVIVGACVPMLQRAMQALEYSEPPFEYMELAWLADALIAEPAAFGVEALAPTGDLQVQWPESSERPPVIVRRLMADDDEIEYAWLVFSSGEWAVHRWIRLESEPAEPTP